MTVQSNTNFPNGITMNVTATVVNTIAQRLGDTDTDKISGADTFSVETAGDENFASQIMVELVSILQVQQYH